jgi:hypothetical protein
MSAVSQPQPIARSAATSESTNRLVGVVRPIVDRTRVLTNAQRLLESPVVPQAALEDDYVRFAHRRNDHCTRRSR